MPLGHKKSAADGKMRRAVRKCTQKSEMTLDRSRFLRMRSRVRSAHSWYLTSFLILSFIGLASFICFLTAAQHFFSFFVLLKNSCLIGASHLKRRFCFFQTFLAQATDYIIYMKYEIGFPSLLGPPRAFSQICNCPLSYPHIAPCVHALFQASFTVVHCKSFVWVLLRTRNSFFVSSRLLVSLPYYRLARLSRKSLCLLAHWPLPPLHLYYSTLFLILQYVMLQEFYAVFLYKK